MNKIFEDEKEAFSDLDRVLDEVEGHGYDATIERRDLELLKVRLSESRDETERLRAALGRIEPPPPASGDMVGFVAGLSIQKLYNFSRAKPEHRRKWLDELKHHLESLDEYGSRTE